jgi:hypothetical protein
MVIQGSPEARQGTCGFGEFLAGKTARVVELLAVLARVRQSAAAQESSPPLGQQANFELIERRP